MDIIAILEVNGYIARNPAFVIRCDWREFDLVLCGLGEASVDSMSNHV